MGKEKSKIFFIFLIGLILNVGCSSKAVKHQVIDVKIEPEKLSTAVIKKKSYDKSINPQAYNFYVNGLIYEGIGNISEAAESFKKALQYHPDSYQLRFSLAESYYRLKQYDNVLAVLDIINPEDKDVYILRAASFMALGKTDSARVAYGELVKLNPNNSVAYSYLAGYYRKSGDIDSLIWSYENMSRIRPGNDRYWRELGRLYAQKGDFEKAKNSFKRSIDVRNDPTNILSYIGLAEIYRISEQYDSAIYIYKDAIEIDSNNIVVNRELSVLYMGFDSLEQAIPYAKKVAMLSPLDRTGIRRLGILYYGLDSLKLADSIFTYLVKSGERNALNHYYLGRIAIFDKDYHRAVDEFTILTQLADSIYESWLDLGYTYRLLKQSEKEILTYQTGLSHVTDEAGELRLLFALGAAYEQYNYIDKAVAVFEEVIAKSPDYDQALNYLGYMLADKGERLEYAKDLIERAVKISPNNVAYLDSYGWVFYRLGQYKKALVHLKKAVALDSDPVIFDHLGDAFKATGDLENAAIWWQKALELAPDNKQLKEKLGN